MDDRIGQQLGNYRLVRLLGRGGFAQVYLAEHLHLKRQVAIKVLHTTLTHKQKESFLIEAQRLVDLPHPSIVRVIDFAIEEDFPYLIMEYAPNGTLRARHPKGSCLSLTTINSYVKYIAAALQYIHEQKLIHRDIKPENLLIGKHQEILLSDFGLATIAHTTSSLSMQGLAGTPLYMAPEQAQGKPRAASDQYALGVVVYEWLCGTVPFQGTVVEVATQHLCTPPLPLRQRIPTILPAVEQVVLKALAKDPQQRFPTITEFAEALEQASQTAQTVAVVPPLTQNRHSSITFNTPTVQLTEPEPDLYSDSSVHLRYSQHSALLPQHIGQVQGYAPTGNNVISPSVPFHDTSPAFHSRKPASSPTAKTIVLPKRKGLPYILSAVLLIVLALSISIAGFSTHWFSGRTPPTQGTLQTQAKTNVPATTPPVTTPVNTAQQNQPNQQTAVLANDTFQRQNQTFWGTASDGRQWGGDANTISSFSIKGQQGQIVYGRGVLNAIIGVPTDNVDITISGSVNQFSSDATLGVILRWSDTNNWYKAVIDGQQLGILKSVDGKVSVISQINVKTSNGVAQTLRFRSLGTMLSAKVWPSGTTEPQNWMLIANDSSLSTGQFGIRVAEQSTTVITILSFNATTASISNNM
jgi:serine/threonine protein kinase